MNFGSRMRVWAGVLALLPGLIGRPVSAQQPDSVQIKIDSVQEMMGAQMEMMGPMMGQMAEASLTGILAALSRPEAAERLATFSRSYYNALVKKGFTKAEALQIVTSVGIPMLRGGQ